MYVCISQLRFKIRLKYGLDSGKRVKFSAHKILILLKIFKHRLRWVSCWVIPSYSYGVSSFWHINFTSGRKKIPTCSVGISFGWRPCQIANSISFTSCVAPHLITDTFSTFMSAHLTISSVETPCRSAVFCAL